MYYRGEDCYIYIAYRCDLAFLLGQYKTKGLQMVLKLELMSCSETSEMLNLFSLSQED